MWEGNSGSAQHSSAGFAEIVSDLFGDLGRDARTLIRQETELARTEIREEVSRAVRIAALGACAVLAGGCALMILSVALSLGLHEIFPTLPMWACFGIIALVETGLAAILASAAKESGKKFSIVPVRTLESLQEGVQCFIRKR